ncbi:replication endonuclease [Pseudomonas sp. EL_65y_Pfl1_R32]|uniref:replication endonuclease n=1 Tax=Pseudomonas sp. EL_65y_Pfl1_R32 TaxID=3088696 RepID=UPI0030DA16E1
MNENPFLSGDCSPQKFYDPSRTPTDVELTLCSLSELRGLAKRFSDQYREQIYAATAEGRQSVLAQQLPYDIKIKCKQGSTVDTRIARLVDPKWWRRKLSALADALREHQAQVNRELGGNSTAQVCCTDAAILAYRERKESTDKALKTQFKIKKTNDDVKVFSLYEISEASRKNRLNEVFLDIKALECIAESKKYGCAFITLTAAPEFHSNPKLGRNTYAGATAREANNALQKDWRSVLDALDNHGVNRKSGRYFGFRVVELHDDGCPHWHILFFFDRSLGIIEVVEDSIRRRYSDRGSYFDAQKDSIVKIIEKNGEATATPSSYIFKYLAFALSFDEKSDDLALRYKCAIRAMGARQYSFFGIKCSVSKQRALKSIARSNSAPRNIKALADALHPSMDIEDRRAAQLNARVNFLEGSADKLTLIKVAKKNRYGEDVSTILSIRHEDDIESVQIAGQSIDISEDEAEKIAKGEETESDVYERAVAREERLVTIITNYSRVKPEPMRDKLAPRPARLTEQARKFIYHRSIFYYLRDKPDYRATVRLLGFSPGPVKPGEAYTGVYGKWQVPSHQ